MYQYMNWCGSTQASLVKGHPRVASLAPSGQFTFRWPSASEVGGIRSTLYEFAGTMGEYVAAYRESPAKQLLWQLFGCPL